MFFRSQTEGEKMMFLSPNLKPKHRDVSASASRCNMRSVQCWTWSEAEGFRLYRRRLSQASQPREEGVDCQIWRRPYSLKLSD